MEEGLVSLQGSQKMIGFCNSGSQMCVACVSTEDNP